LNQENPSQRARKRRVAAQRAAKAARILVCDCDTDAPRPVSDDLLKLGYEFVAHHTLADCLREATEAPFDAIVISVPRLLEEKFKLLQLLRRATPGVPLVVVTSDGSLEMRTRCQGVRPLYFAVRPVPLEELRDALKGALTRVAARD